MWRIVANKFVVSTFVILHFLGAPHAVAAVVAEVAVAVADRDRAAVVAGWGVELEAGELFFPRRGAGVLVDVNRHARAMEHGGVLFDDAERFLRAVDAVGGSI